MTKEQMHFQTEFWRNTKLVVLTNRGSNQMFTLLQIRTVITVHGTNTNSQPLPPTHSHSLTHTDTLSHSHTLTTIHHLNTYIRWHSHTNPHTPHNLQHRMLVGALTANLPLTAHFINMLTSTSLFRCKWVWLNECDWMSMAEWVWLNKWLNECDWVSVTEWVWLGEYDRVNVTDMLQHGDQTQPPCRVISSIAVFHAHICVYLPKLANIQPTHSPVDQFIHAHTHPFVHPDLRHNVTSL